MENWLVLKSYPHYPQGNMCFWGITICEKKNGRFVDCDKTAKNDGVWQKNAGVFKIGNHLKYTEYSENFS